MSIETRGYEVRWVWLLGEQVAVLFVGLMGLQGRGGGGAEGDKLTQNKW